MSQLPDRVAKNAVLAAAIHKRDLKAISADAHKSNDRSTDRHECGYSDGYGDSGYGDSSPADINPDES